MGGRFAFMIFVRQGGCAARLEGLQEGVQQGSEGVQQSVREFSKAQRVCS